MIDLVNVKFETMRLVSDVQRSKMHFTTFFPDTCSNPLGLEDGSVSASQLSASSSHEPSSVGANNGRLNVDVAGGAWCPRSLIDADAKEFIEVDFGDQPHLITAVLTQGRFGNGHGQEFSEAYFVEYTRTGMNFWLSPPLVKQQTNINISASTPARQSECK
jgi:hypothetical protein